MTLEIKWTKEYFLGLEGPEGIRVVGSGWHKAGKSVTLQAPPTAFSPGEDERLQFIQWDPISNPSLVIPNRQVPITSIRMDNTHVLRAVYERAVLVVVQNPLGTIKKEWISIGRELALDTPSTIGLDPDRERYEFKGWEGVDVTSAKGFVVVDGPLSINALYERQFNVKIVSPYGASGDGWYNEGETVTVRVPENPSSLFFLKKSFDGFSGYDGVRPTLLIQVTEPLTITASYRTEVDVTMLSIILGALAVVGIVYLVTQRTYVRRESKEEQSVSPDE